MSSFQAQTLDNERQQCTSLSKNCVDVFRNAEEGERITMSFVAKTDDIYRGEWHKATASKKEDHFEVIFDENPSIILQYYNSDEQKSLVSENLWAIGWYMLPDQADALSRQKDNGQGSVAVEDINHINRNNFEGKYFEGELRSGMKCKFFESVTCTRGKTVFTFNTVDSVLHKSEIGVFFFAVEFYDGSEAEAVVFFQERNLPSFVPLLQLVKQELSENAKVDNEEFHHMKETVREFIKQHL